MKTVHAVMSHKQKSATPGTIEKETLISTWAPMGLFLTVIRIMISSEEYW